jgi:geranylgeranyl diphosphate synthase, type I
MTDPAQSRKSERRPGSFADLVSDVRGAVEARLEVILADAVDAVRPCGDDSVAAIDALRALCMRGGKRFRPVLVAAAAEACGGDHANEAVVLAGAAIELLQAYLLIHDDWMDGDEVRRGGPSVHAMLRATYGDAHHGDAAAILAGDFASALAQQALFAMPLAPERVIEAGRAFARVQREVIAGQLIDLRGDSDQDGESAQGADRSTRVESMHDLKTGSYTVRGPLSIGAILAGASAEQRAALDRFAAPLGIAFQLRDDLLGTFGDPRATGKPAGNDVRRGKRTALVAALAGDAEAARLMPLALGVVDASDANVSALVARMNVVARPIVEARLAELLGNAERELAAAPLAARGKSWLQGAVKALGERET